MTTDGGVIEGRGGRVQSSEDEGAGSRRGWGAEGGGREGGE